MKIRLKKLPEQVMVITGATSGIGLVTARKAARQGARLVLVARNEDALKQICDELNGQGAEATYVVADVGKEDEIRLAASTAIQRFGRIDTWINNAGIGMFGRNEEVSTEDKRRLFETNFWGVVYGSLAATEHLKRGGGALINIGSEVSDVAVPLQGIYAASKHAVKGFTDSLRIELQEAGAPVSVTLIKPGSIDTMFAAHAKNYMDVEPKLPPPIYAPDIVADAILHAATHPERDIFVGGGAKMAAAGAYYMPGVIDRVMKRVMFGQQRSDVPARHRANSLYSPSQDLKERNGVGGRTRETSLYTTAITGAKSNKALMLGAGLALAAVWQMRRNGGFKHKYAVSKQT